MNKETKRRITTSINAIEDALDIARIRGEFLFQDVDMLDSGDIERIRSIRHDIINIISWIENLLFEFKNQNDDTDD